jgi:hypothetical protein
MKYGICKDNSEYIDTLTKGKTYKILATMGYAGYVVRLQDDKGDTLLYPACIFTEDTKPLYDFSDVKHGPVC